MATSSTVQMPSRITNPLSLAELAHPRTEDLPISLGRCDTEDIDAEQLVRQADQAMYRAKQTGKNRYHVFDTQQHALSDRG